MQMFSVNELGAVGFIADKEPRATPPNAWSEMQNMRCIDRSIGSFAGHESVATITEQPETMITVKTGQKTFIVYAGQGTIYSVRGPTETTIGSGFATNDTWDSCVLGGVGIFCSFSNNPQYWGGSGNTVDLPYDSTGDTICTWTDATLRAKVIRPFRYHLFALNIEDCDGHNPRKVWWSHPADPGELPVTWDPTKPDYNAGFVELSETPGEVIDGLALRDTFQIYKSDAIYAATFTGTFDGLIFNFRQVTSSYGLYSRNCVCDVGGRHFFVGDGDIFLYDGTNFKSIADERVKDYFFDNVSRTYRDRSFATYYERTGEVWLCFPTAEETSCNEALVWDSKKDAWSQRQLPGVTAATIGVVDRSSGWDYGTGDGGTDTYGAQWDAAITSYGAFMDDSPYKESLILGGATDLFEMDRTNTADGVTMTCYVRRTELDLGDKADWHMALEIYPHAEGDPFNVKIGYQNNLTEAVTWSSAQSFDPDTDHRLNFRVTGRLHAVEFSSAADVSWKVSGFDIDFQKVGRR
ncbi:MAG: hypothetical protein KJN90_01430 [Gammaproteobacteria bacterium]|nr:hypothetical protein [Gammaproteobacteria bacterium]